MADTYEAMCREMLAKIRATEPGVLFFDIGKCRDKENCFQIIEVYRDEAALAAHYQTDHFIACKPIMTECIAELIKQRYDSFAEDLPQ
jgi:quinol monooxygenase YgiN